MNDMTNTSLIALPSEPSAIAAFFSEPTKVESLIEAIENKCAEHVPDLTTAKGRDAIKSLAYDVARSKTALDKAGKVLNDDKRAAITAVDAERRKIRDRLDDLRDLVRRPLTEWEDAEEKRKSNLQDRLAMFNHEGFSALNLSEDIQSRINELEAISVDDTWQEFEDEALFAKTATLNALQEHLKGAKDREAQAAELESLRKEKAEREEREAAERAKAEKEQKDREAEALRKAESERIEREKAEAANRARQESEERAAREKAEAEEEYKRQIEAAHQATEDAARLERERIEREQAVQEAEKKRRERSKLIRKEKSAQIATALRAIDPFTPEIVAEALLDRKIPHVEINY